MPAFSDALTVSILDAPPPRRFDCGRSDQNEFLHQHAWADQQHSMSTTYTFSRGELMAAFATVCLDGLRLAADERGSGVRFSQVGAVKLAQLGVHTAYHGQGVGSRAIGFVVLLAREVSERIGCRYVVLDSQPDLVEWYARQGFVHNRRWQEERVREAVKHRRDPARIPVSMRFDLRPAKSHGSTASISASGE
jgi:GNAT superfamily N-acetyltransferase